MVSLKTDSTYAIEFSTSHIIGYNFAKYAIDGKTEGG